jgi:hypothetical protein
VVSIRITQLATASLNAEAAQANERARQAEERAANAEAHLGDAKSASAQAERHAAEANEKAEEFRLQITQANEGAAKAEKATEDERMARVKIEERLSKRSLSREQQERIVEKLKPFSGTQYALLVNPTFEAIQLLHTFDDILHSAGWLKEPCSPTIHLQSSNGDVFGMELVSGISIEVADTSPRTLVPAAEALVLALRSGGIQAVATISDAGLKACNVGRISGTPPDANAIHIIVGSKE